MKIATFNLFQFAQPGHFWYEKVPHCSYDSAEWQQKQTWIRQRLRAMDADIIGFQEVFSVDALRELCQKAGYAHFITSEQPDVSTDNPWVFTRPVVALASRFPVKNTRNVELHTDVKTDLRLDDNFRFSRAPVCAAVDVPGIGAVTVYVVHLKSKRPVTEDIEYDDKTEWLDRSRDTLMRLSRGNVGSMLQRGAEATLLYHHAMQNITAGQAVIVMGDMNDNHESAPLAALTMQTRIHSIGGIEFEQWPDNVKRYLHDHRLSDSFRLAPTMRQRVRPFTHIHRGTGNTLDYILVSNGLNPKNALADAEIVDYQVWNQHLSEDGVENRLQSDHGQVCVEIIPTRLVEKPENTGRLYKVTQAEQVTTRQDFIELAGGVFQSYKHFRQWSSDDKWEQFWSFFFDSAYGWVTSIYGSVPVDELYQKKKHSIEHIIPRDFLDRYLSRQHAPRHVRYGATVNPFNLAPSERGLNAKRSNFPFDLDGDKVVRPRHLKIHANNFDPVGLDADNEWVIPSRNRGDVARSLLYMLLVYEIDELYNDHISTLVHWAKIDSPSAWELAYNQWIYSKLGIRNPFIDTPQNALKLLDNKELIRSIAMREKR